MEAAVLLRTPPALQGTYVYFYCSFLNIKLQKRRNTGKRREIQEIEQYRKIQGAIQWGKEQYRKIQEEYRENERNAIQEDAE